MLSVTDYIYSFLPILYQYKSSRPYMFCKKVVLKNFVQKSQENTCRAHFLIKL